MSQLPTSLPQCSKMFSSSALSQLLFGCFMDQAHCLDWQAQSLCNVFILGVCARISHVFLYDQSFGVIGCFFLILSFKLLSKKRWGMRRGKKKIYFVRPNKGWVCQSKIILSINNAQRASELTIRGMTVRKMKKKRGERKRGSTVGYVSPQRDRSNNPPPTHNPESHS